MSINPYALCAVVFFVLGYLGIALEHYFRTNKAVTAALLGAGLWILVAIRDGHGAEKAIHPVAEETFGLIIFLLSAMMLVEILVHYRFFDLVRDKIYTLGLGDRAQLWLMAMVSFFLSAVIDNLTTTIVMVQISSRFFKGRNLLVAGSAVVICANAGGAFSPIGDVTTIMLWIAGKFTASEIVLWGFLPSITLTLVSTWLLARGIRTTTTDDPPQTFQTVQLSRSEKLIVTMTFVSFSFPVIAKMIGLPPFIGLLFGVGLIGVVVGTCATGISERESHLSLDIQRLLAKVDVASLLFFVGILFAVGALGHFGVLELISKGLLGPNPDAERLIMGNAFLGVASAIVDNIPLTAAAIDIINSKDPAIWALLAVAVGTGGSLLSIGSAAGVVAVGMIKELTFGEYMRIASAPALAGYLSAMTVWFGQYLLFH